MFHSEGVVKTEKAGFRLLWNHHYSFTTCIHTDIYKARWSKMSQPLYHRFPCATVRPKLWEPPRCKLKLASRSQGQIEEIRSGW